MGMFDWLKGNKSASTAQPIRNGGGEWVTIHEPFTGAWQRNQEIEISRSEQMQHTAVFSCVSLISRDIGKLKIKTKREVDGVKQEVSSSMAKLLKKPNHYQTTQQFFEAWATSKLTNGNTYVLKVRNIYGELWRLIILNPDRVMPLVDEDGNIYYQIKKDKLFDIDSDTVVPASEIIHDRFNCFYHPLVGLSPITACALSASQGINIQRNATNFFSNASRPSGILVMPGPLSKEKAKEIGDAWNANYSGVNAGKTGVLGDGVEYKPISVSAADAQLVEQTRMSNEGVCTAFVMPPFKIGIGTLPAGFKPSDLNELYYSDCLQPHLEGIENLLNEHLDLEEGVEVEFCLDGLIRMDSASRMTYLKDGIGSAILSPNEARAKLGYKPVSGGDSPMIQQQNYSLEALAKRDAQADPFTNQPVGQGEDNG